MAQFLKFLSKKDLDHGAGNSTYFLVLAQEKWLSPLNKSQIRMGPRKLKGGKLRQQKFEEGNN